MSGGCDHDCGSCSENCASKESLTERTNEMSSVGKVIGIVSGKGGVGKSSVTAMLAVLARRKGFKTAVLDADITGPSIPRAFGLTDKARGEENFIFPSVTKTGIEVMSMNLLLEDEGQPVIWRGPILAGAVKQFWTDVVWGEVDYMFVDMPPGTGDVPLTVFQSLPLDGIVMVTTPQELVTAVVEKAVNMARMMKIPILGLVENMSYYLCPRCGEKISVFGESRLARTSEEFGIENTARLPVTPEIASLCDRGLIELFEGDFLDEFGDRLEEALRRVAFATSSYQEPVGRL